MSSSTSVCLILLRQYLSVTSRWLSAERVGPYETPASLSSHLLIHSPGFIGLCGHTWLF